MKNSSIIDGKKVTTVDVAVLFGVGQPAGKMQQTEVVKFVKELAKNKRGDGQKWSEKLLEASGPE